MRQGVTRYDDRAERSYMLVLKRLREQNVRGVCKVYTATVGQFRGNYWAYNDVELPCACDG